MICYDVYSLQLGFYPVAVVNKLIKNRKERAIYKGEIMHQTIQKHRIHK